MSFSAVSSTLGRAGRLCRTAFVNGYYQVEAYSVQHSRGNRYLQDIAGHLVPSRFREEAGRVHLWHVIFEQHQLCRRPRVTGQDVDDGHLLKKWSGGERKTSGGN